MKLLLKILGGLAAFVLILVLGAYLLPRQYRIERSILIKASPDVVREQVADLRAWKNWGVWYERDPQMKMEYSQPSTGVGAWSKWESKSEGSGKMTITEQSTNTVVYLLEFPDFGMSSTGRVELLPQADGVNLQWSDSGDLGMNPINRWFGLFLEGMIGPDFEQGLSNIKKRTEK